MQICKHSHAGLMGFDSCLATFIINWSADKSFPEMLCFVGACSEAPSDLSSIPIMIIAVVIPLNNSKSIKNLSYSSIVVTHFLMTQALPDTRDISNWNWKFAELFPWTLNQVRWNKAKLRGSVNLAKNQHSNSK